MKKDHKPHCFHGNKAFTSATCAHWFSRTQDVGLSFQRSIWGLFGVGTDPGLSLGSGIPPILAQKEQVKKCLLPL